MISTVASPPPAPPGTEPAWDIARIFPYQGVWDERDYLALDTNHLVELTDGYVEVLPMPKPGHQRIVKRLIRELEAFIGGRGLGEVLFAPLRIRLRKDKFREPDVVFMLSEHESRKGEDYWNGADLVVEVVSDDPGSRERDHVKKLKDYAEAEIPEYWIVDPQESRVRVFRLEGPVYVMHGDFSPSQLATSALLDGFSMDVTALFAAAAG